MATQPLEIEIWDKSKQRIADITNLAENRAAVFKLNGVDTFQFSMNLHRFEDFSQKNGIHPRTLLWPLTCDIILKLNGQYWKGFECSGVHPYLSKDGATLSVRGRGFLSLFKKRYVTVSYSATERTAIAAGLINATQSQTNGDLGVTIGAQQFITGITSDRNYELKNVKDGLVELTRLETGKFDINFTHDKQFETYEMLGSLQSDTPLIYGTGGNIKNVDVPTEGDSVANHVTGLGSGFGDDQVRSTPGVGDDGVSQLAYERREEIPQWNSVKSQDELDENTAGYLAQVKDMLQIPNITVTSNEINLLTTSVGDRFPVDLTQHLYTDNINGLYRVEEMAVNWDDNDFADITFKFDDNGVDQDEA